MKTKASSRQSFPGTLALRTVDSLINAASSANFCLMPFPELNEDGLLPEGIHDCTLDEIGARFGLFVASDRRVRLFEKLCALVEEEQKAGLAIEIFIDGSFVTDTPQPNDIDLVIVLPADYNRAVVMTPFRYNAVSKISLRRRYPFDVFVFNKDTRPYQDQIEFFRKTREGRRKGILRILL